MFQRTKNKLTIQLDVDFTDYTNPTFYVRQQSVELSYTPTVDANDNTIIYVEIPKTDALKLNDRPCEIQLAMTDSDGIPALTEAMAIDVNRLIWEAGYGS